VTRKFLKASSSCRLAVWAIFHVSCRACRGFRAYGVASPAKALDGRRTRGRKRCHAGEEKASHVEERACRRKRHCTRAEKEGCVGGNERDSRAYSFTRRCLIWNPRHLRVGGKERREGKRRRRRSTRNPAAEHFEPGGGTCAPPSMTLAPP